MKSEKLTMNQNSLPDELQYLKRVCIICKKEIMLCCGGWMAQTSGCGVGVDFKGTHYLLTLYAHIPCLMKNMKNRIRKWFSEKEVMKIYNDRFGVKNDERKDGKKSKRL